MINKVILPVEGEGDKPELTRRAVLCKACGYLHPLGDEPPPDLCESCGVSLPPAWENLFRMQNVATRRRDRINSDEEERFRLGYDLVTGVRFAARGGHGAARTSSTAARASPSWSTARRTTTRPRPGATTSRPKRSKTWASTSSASTTPPTGERSWGAIPRSSAHCLSIVVQPSRLHPAQAGRLHHDSLHHNSFSSSSTTPGTRCSRRSPRAASPSTPGPTSSPAAAAAIETTGGLALAVRPDEPGLADRIARTLGGEP